MAAAIQIVKDSTRETVVKLTNDGTTESAVTKVDASTLSGADSLASFHELMVTNITWSVANGTVALIWAGGTPATIAELSGNGALRYTGGEFVLLKNNAGTPTGDVLLTTRNFGATSIYTIIITLAKSTNFNRGGVDSVG
jgi:hypothetical protein